MINLENIFLQFKENKVLNDVSLKIETGKTLALVGENGAGKTSLMRIISGFLKPCFGKVSIFNKDISLNLMEVKADIGYMPEGSPLYYDMEVFSFLKFMAEAKKVTPSKMLYEISRVSEITDLKNVLKSDIGVLSKGFKRRVALAGAIISDPKILLLDEPAEGLDPNQKEDLKQKLKDMNKTIIISSHVLEDVKAFSSDIAILHKGKIVFKSDMATLNNKDLNQIFRKYTKNEGNN